MGFQKVSPQNIAEAIAKYEFRAEREPQSADEV